MSSIPVRFQYGRFREHPWLRGVRKTQKTDKKPGEKQRKNPES